MLGLKEASQAIFICIAIAITIPTATPSVLADIQPAAFHMDYTA
jgi:hypothetical protein